MMNISVGNGSDVVVVVVANIVNNVSYIDNVTSVDPTNSSIVPDFGHCPDYDRSGEILLENLGFYLEGIIQTSLAIAGLLSNFISCLVLASKEMRNSFNLVSCA